MNWIGFAVAHHLNSDSSKAVEVLEAYEGTLEDDYPPENERYEHNEMLLYKYDRHFAAKYELGKEVGRGHFDYTCSRPPARET
ncbi:N-terminal acetyltransferase A complex auxiliary subunit NAA15 [Zea mays]|uniref:N-terminal acetyltransferase A complex auxiliary subunit NAA15 n=1 Tax=Zea mays TaxID=4577 RepID=UPI00165230DC|nr:N-terminal acetyltransferase A complex auxiliary subunit NAA15 [Zea mays]